MFNEWRAQRKQYGTNALFPCTVSTEPSCNLPGSRPMHAHGHALPPSLKPLGSGNTKAALFPRDKVNKPCNNRGQLCKSRPLQAQACCGKKSGPQGKPRACHVALGPLGLPCDAKAEVSRIGSHLHFQHGDKSSCAGPACKICVSQHECHNKWGWESKHVMPALQFILSSCAASIARTCSTANQQL